MIKLNKEQLRSVKLQVLANGESLCERPVPMPVESGIAHTQRIKLSARQTRKLAKYSATKLADKLVMKTAINDAVPGAMVRIKREPEYAYFRRRFGDGMHMIVEGNAEKAYSYSNETVITLCTALMSNGEIVDKLSPLMFELV